MAAALAGPTMGPLFSVTSQDVLAVQRWTLLTATGFSSARNTSILTSSSSIIRAAVVGSTISIYRIPAGGLGTAANWTAAARATPSANAQSTAGCALVQTGSTIRCFWIDVTDKKPRYSDSTDDGATWSAATAGFPAPPLTFNLTHGIAAATITDLYVAYADYAQASDGIFRSQWTGVWGAWSGGGGIGPPTPVWGQLRGLQIDAKKGGGSPMVFAAGVQMRFQKSGVGASTATFDGTATWSTFTSIEDNDSPSNGLSRAYPTVHYDAGSATYYHAAILTDDGSVSGTAQNRVNIWSSTDGLKASIIAPLGNVFANEVHVILQGGSTYVFDNHNVYSAPSAPAATDLTNDVLSMHIQEKAGNHSHFQIVVANQAGQYTGLANLKDNAKVHIQLGIAGYALVDCWDAFIDAVRYEARGDIIAMIIEARGYTKLLDQNSQRFIPIASKTVAQIAQQICQLANVSIAALPGTSQFSQVIPCFTITQGESWWQALKRLGNVYDFDLTVGTPVTVKASERLASDTSTWSYGTEALASVRQLNADQPNIIRVVGSTTGGANNFAEAQDISNMASSGQHRYQHIVDRMLDSSAKCQIKANLALRSAQTEGTTGSLTVTVNPQLEVLDPITITDTRTGYSATKMRIMAIDTIFDFHTGVWEQRLELNLP
jgi:hypothetical protein